MARTPKDKYAAHDQGSTGVNLRGEDYELIARTRQVLGAATFKETVKRALRFQLAHTDPPARDESDIQFASEIFLSAAANQEAEDGRDHIRDTLGLMRAVLNKCKDDPDQGRARLGRVQDAVRDAIAWEAPRQETLAAEVES